MGIAIIAGSVMRVGRGSNSGCAQDNGNGDREGKRR
jgi:hypothetical protein